MPLQSVGAQRGCLISSYEEISRNWAGRGPNNDKFYLGLFKEGEDVSGAGLQSLPALFGDRGSRKGFPEYNDLLMNTLVSCYWDHFYIASKRTGINSLPRGLSNTFLLFRCLFGSSVSVCRSGWL